MIEANDCVMVMADYDLYKILMIILISLLSDASFSIIMTKKEEMWVLKSGQL